MLGRKTKRHPGGTTVTTTTTTTHHPGDAPVGRRGRSAGTTTAKPSLMQRLRGGNAAPRSAATTTQPARKSRFGGGTRKTHAAPATTTAAPRRKTSLGDKVSGAMMKLKGSAEGRPGEKAAARQATTGRPRLEGVPTLCVERQRAYCNIRKLALIEQGAVDAYDWKSHGVSPRLGLLVQYSTIPL
ncbi:hypothetical protein LTS07_004704 [Exophiala sideris]|nr:hypothetical protein LTS07_004704 [Exophiala sideris]KAK5184356.1 hypothetical protein LTR44_003029 [Eurotiomycetes sp. CCFEE 6388]